jgi:hypothetical protein
MMTKYLAEVRRIEKFFDGFKVRYVPRLDNCDADHLAWIASSRAPTLSDVIVDRLFKPSVKPEESTGQAELELMIIDEPAQQPVDDWMGQIRTYLDNQPPSDDNIKVKRIEHKSRTYHLIDGVLFCQGDKRNDDEVHLKRRHRAIGGCTQGCMRITLVLVLDCR